MQQRATLAVETFKIAHLQQALTQRRVHDSETKVRALQTQFQASQNAFQELQQSLQTSQQLLLTTQADKEALQKMVTPAENSAQVANQQVQILEQFVGEANTQIEDLWQRVHKRLSIELRMQKRGLDRKQEKDLKKVNSHCWWIEKKSTSQRKNLEGGLGSSESGYILWCTLCSQMSV